MKRNYSENRISIGEAAEMLGMGDQTVRRQMQIEKLPIGIADKSEKAANNYTYYIYKGRVTAYMKGMDIALELLEKSLSGNEIKDMFKELLREMLPDIVRELLKETMPGIVKELLRELMLNSNNKEAK